MSDGGKGSTPRPLSVSQAEYEARWDAIFGRDVPQQAPAPQHHEASIQDAMTALSHSNLDGAWHILRTIKDRTEYWRERALQAEAELQAARGHK